MKIHFLGTCSGTEPMPGMHHCSLIMEVNDHLYWFDAGECCSHTAYTSGVDITKTKAIFISHPHIDHIGGLADLLFCLEKMVFLGRSLAHDNAVHIYFPDMGVLEAVKTVSGFEQKITLNEYPVTDGVLFEDENIRVTAAHNRHLPQNSDGSWRSFSYLVEAEGKRLIFSGDVKKPEDLDALNAQDADLLIMETGHHHPKDVCEYAMRRGIKKLRFNHHGRVILNDRPAVEQLIADYAIRGAMSTKICYDGMVEEF